MTAPVLDDSPVRSALRRRLLAAASPQEQTLTALLTNT